MQELPPNFGTEMENLLSGIASVEGFLSDREMRFLALLAAFPTAAGGVLEIGSFKGRSTIILVKFAKLAGDGTVHAVDPMTAPSETDPDLKGDDSAIDDFLSNLRRFGVAEAVRHHQMHSNDLAPAWDLPLRLLWIDGDHTYKGTLNDLQGFEPHLADGAIVAVHDVLHEFEGGARVFAENILLSPNYGACGFCGSVGWAQYFKDERESVAHRELKISLYKRLSRLIPYVALGGTLSGVRKKRYKLLRALVPHGEVDPREFARLVKTRNNEVESNRRP